MTKRLSADGVIDRNKSKRRKKRSKRINNARFMAPTETYARRLSTPETKKLVPRTYSPKQVKHYKTLNVKPNWRNVSMGLLGFIKEEPGDQTAAMFNKIRKDHIERFGYYYERELLPAYQAPTDAYQRKVKERKEQDDFQLNLVEPEERKAPKNTKDWRLNDKICDAKRTRRGRLSRNYNKLIEASRPTEAVNTNKNMWKTMVHHASAIQALKGNEDSDLPK